MNDIVRFEKVTKRYPNGYVGLYEVSFNLVRGEMLFLTGHSGAGKSTLLKLISLIERPTQGQILLDDQHIGRISDSRIPYLRRSIGMVFQNPRLLSSHTVFDNVALPLVIAGFGHQDIQRRVRAALDKVNLLSKEKLYPESLSGGEQQRVGIARAVVNKPPLLLADEPTGNLDANLAVEIMGLFEEFNKVGVSVIIASHDMTLVNRFKRRLLTLQAGMLAKADQEAVYVE